jgi:hypothetical protein
MKMTLRSSAMPLSTRFRPGAHETTGAPAAGRCSPLIRLLRGGFALSLAAGASVAAAQTTVTLYGGARGGGEFENASTSSESYSLDSGAVVSASVDWMLRDGRQAQVFYSFQRSALPGAAFGQAGEVTVNVSYLHFGGRVFFDGGVPSGGAYLVGGIGAAFLSPGQSGLSDEIRPSINIGVGYQWPLSASIALRAELRGYATLINSEGGFFCSGGCVVSIRGNSLVQGEGLLGLSIGF